MFLTREEEAMLSGELGEAVATAMRVIVKVGEALGADELVKIGHAHVSGISYNNIGEPGLRFIKRLADLGARVSVYSTVNPIGMDADSWQNMVVEEFASKQMEVLRYLARMGFMLSLTCTPYYIRPPRMGEHLAWGESSAVVYANTVYGARTNREGGPLALMAAITGRTYKAGLHLEENRRPTVLVNVEKGLVNEYTDASLLGGFLGMSLGSGIPYVRAPGLDGLDLVKGMGAAAGALGSIGLILVEGVSPEARMYSRDLRCLERLHVGREELEEVRNAVDSGGDPDLLYLGCPHASIRELRILDSMLRGRRSIRREFWVSVSRAVYLEAAEEGLVSRLREHGVKILRDTCPVVAPLRDLGYRVVGTNSVKTAFYMPRVHGIGARVLRLEEMVGYAYS